MRRLMLSVLSCVVLTLTLALPAQAQGSFPEVIPLPNGFQPEGIAINSSGTFYVGSIPTGAIYRGDLATGAGGTARAADAGPFGDRPGD